MVKHPFQLRTQISIHAPAKGATEAVFHPAYELIFQSTLPRRERQDVTPYIQPSYLYFNPRSREGSDAAFPASEYNFQYFNPRSREGSDLTGLFSISSFE